SDSPFARIALRRALDLNPLETQRPLSGPRADAVRRNLEASWRKVEPMVFRSSPPDEQSASGMDGERARIGMRDRPDQVVNLSCRPMPLDPAVFRGPSTVIGRLALILRHPRRPAIAKPLVGFPEQHSGLVRRQTMEGQRGIVLADRKPSLRHHVAPV